MENEVLVSICCITYNQQQYIEEAIKGFLKQKVNFKYEIIIYDDASTDNTVNIIKKYMQDYPDIIKPIFSKENKYTKGEQTFLYTFEKAKGKYIALCEGDDYWIDENKLQMQVDYMEANPNCTFCFHNAYVLYMKHKKKVKFITNKPKFKKNMNKDGNYGPGDIHLIGCGMIPTASFFFRSEYVSKIPDWFKKCFCGDMPLKLIMTSFGYAHYIDKIMSVYRKETGISVTDQWQEKEKNIQIKIARFEKAKEILDWFNEFTKYKYNDKIQLSKKYYDISILLFKKNYRKILNKDYAKYYKILKNDNFYMKLLIKSFLDIIWKEQ